MLRQQQSKILDGIGSPQNCGKRHIQSNAYFTSSLLTRFSTWLRRVNISRLVSFISVCNVSRLVAICSTALVSLITAAAASSLRRENPNSPIAATEMEAPSAAARISITAQAGVACILTRQPRGNRRDYSESCCSDAIAKKLHPISSSRARDRIAIVVIMRSRVLLAQS